MVLVKGLRAGDRTREQALSCRSLFLILLVLMIALADTRARIEGDTMVHPEVQSRPISRRRSMIAAIGQAVSRYRWAAPSWSSTDRTWASVNGSRSTAGWTAFGDTDRGCSPGSRSFRPYSPQPGAAARARADFLDAAAGVRRDSAGWIFGLLLFAGLSAPATSRTSRRSRSSWPD